MTAKLCTCPMREDGPDYGQSWIVDIDGDTPMKCGACGGEIRPEQDRKWAKEWIDGMTKPGPRPHPFGEW